MAQNGQKVVIIGADMRKPRLHKVLGANNDIGLSNYLIGKSDLEKIIFKSQYQNLDFITSGPIPPNPMELIEGKYFKELLKKLDEKYDCVVFDAPPIGLVADYFSIGKYSDINLYMVRQNYTKKI